MNPLANLRDQITASFNIDELKDLCFELQIDYEDLPGDSKRAKVRELIEYCQRHGLIPDLKQQVHSSRPELNFQEIDSPYEANADLEPMRKILSACYRRAIFTRTQAQMSHEAMFKSIQHALELVQPQVPLLTLAGHQEYASQIVSELDQILRYQNDVFDRYEKIDESKVRILSLLSNLANDTNLPFKFPTDNKLGEEIYFDIEEANKEPEIDQPNIRHPYERLFKILTSYFTEDELKNLALHLKIDYEALPGDNEREKAQELVSYCQQHELIDTLIQGIEQAPEGIYFVPRLSSKQANQTNNTPNIVIPASWPSEIRCKFCGALIRLIDLDDHLANGIELSSEEYDFLLEKEEHEIGGNWEVSGLIICRNCGRENPLIEGHIATHVHDNYKCSNCKKTGYMSAHINKIEGWLGTAFVRRITFILICENCNQRGFRRKLLRSFQDIKSLLIRNTDIRIKRTPRLSKG